MPPDKTTTTGRSQSTASSRRAAASNQKKIDEMLSVNEPKNTKQARAYLQEANLLPEYQLVQGATRDCVTEVADALDTLATEVQNEAPQIYLAIRSATVLLRLGDRDKRAQEQAEAIRNVMEERMEEE